MDSVTHHAPRAHDKAEIDRAFREPEKVGLCALETRICPNCDKPTMTPEHAHSRCSWCGYRDSCCEGSPA